jgi:mRNA-degrading endonuclease toxin of MazEF toxin-antitoxin module
MTVICGDVVLVDYPFTTGRAKVRPALVVQNDRDNARMTNTIVAQISGNTARVNEVTQHLIAARLQGRNGSPSQSRFRVIVSVRKDRDRSRTEKANKVSAVGRHEAVGDGRLKKMREGRRRSSSSRHHLRLSTERRGPLPSAQNVLISGLGPQFGLFRLVRTRGRSRSFWVGFELAGLVVTFTFIGTFFFFPDSTDILPCYWVAYCYELAGGLLYHLLPPRVLPQDPFIWWLGAAILLLLPQLLIALTGGLLMRLIVLRSGKPGLGKASQSPSANPLPAWIGWSRNRPVSGL